jgi:hypothetical protein
MFQTLYMSFGVDIMTFFGSENVLATISKNWVTFFRVTLLPTQLFRLFFAKPPSLLGLYYKTFYGRNL